MKLYIRYILAFVALIVVPGCALDELGLTPEYNSSSDVVTIIGRITRFDDYDVATRGVKSEDEAKLTSMAMALFPVISDGNGGLTTGPCDYYQYTANQAELLFTVDRTVEGFDKNAPYVMYVFTNMPGLGDFEKGDSLEEILAVAYNVTDINIPTNGFPMIGSLGDTFSTNIDQDGKVFILAPTVDGTDDTDLIAPKVDGTTQTLLTVPMKALFAKVNFTIEVRPDQQIEGNYSPQFTLGGYTVNNVPSKVDFNNNTNSGTEVLSEGKTLSNADRTTAVGANKINFSFYLPERLMTPATTWDQYDYPFGKGNAIRNEDLIYRQRYKPMLLGSAQKATNVVISGRFRDHQNQYWDVDYTIYLGADNYGDFNILRNAEYNNIVTIRGIQTSSDMSDVEGAISIDHRVNVERTQPGIITLRRETLLDSHFEVRPLRVRKSDVSNIDNINAVKVEVVEPNTTNWMRLERSFGDGTPAGSPETTVNGEKESIYIDEDQNSPSYGKRRFFTYNLIDGVNADATDATLKNSTSVILPLTEATECCWIYVDECTEIGDDVRAGQIKVSYGNLSGTTFTPANNAEYPDVTYIINQRKLFNVTGATGRTYNIEYSEEYLYNFDADDAYGQTQYNGMPWGLNNIQLSYDNRSAYISESGGFLSLLLGLFGGNMTSFINNYLDDISAKYDFYIERDKAVNPNATVYNYNGYNFCNDIIQEINGASGNDTDRSNDINVLQLDQKPKSAIEYCYNKNKRNNKGQVVWSTGTNNYNQSQLNWYLPAIDEVEDIVMSEYGNKQKTYARFLEFQDKFYWSSQPSYDMYGIYIHTSISGSSGTGTYFEDDRDRARATKVAFNQTYVNVPSGVTGVLGTNSYEVETYIIYTRVHQEGFTASNNTITYDPGNKSRTDMARVRCVRKP